MFAAVGNHVTNLVRTRIGALDLATTGLQPGEYRTTAPDRLMEMIRPQAD